MNKPTKREWGGYESGEVKVAKPGYEHHILIHLPHSCDEWIIGDADQARLLIADLEAAIEKYDG